MSSPSAAQTVRTFYDFFLAGQVEEASKQSLDPSFVLTNPLPAPIPFGGRFEGVAGFLEYMAGIAQEIEIKEFVIDEILADGDRVVVTGRERSRVIRTDREYEMEWVHVLDAAGGRVQAMREYNDTAAMRDAYEPNS
jgi:ketosteroid isomerase-like protein